MATITQGVMGGFTGKVGTVVGYQWRGKWCMRARPSFIRNPRSEAQQAHRMMFREEVRLASRLNWLLRESMEQLAYDEGLTPCNYFIKENQCNFHWEVESGERREKRGESGAGRLTVDWANLVLSHGPVAPVGFDVPEVTEETQLTITFEKNPLHMQAAALDKVYLFLYCEATGECFLTAPVYRCDRRISVVLPHWWAGKELQLWGLVEDREGRWSETIYIGYGNLAPDLSYGEGEELEAVGIHDVVLQSDGEKQDQRTIEDEGGTPTELMVSVDYRPSQRHKPDKQAG